MSLNNNLSLYKRQFFRFWITHLYANFGYLCSCPGFCNCISLPLSLQKYYPVIYCGTFCRYCKNGKIHFLFCSLVTFHLLHRLPLQIFIFFNCDKVDQLLVNYCSMDLGNTLMPLWLIKLRYI